MRIQTKKYGLYDVIRIKKKEFILMLRSFTPYDINFKTILMPKGILGKFYPKHARGKEKSEQMPCE